MKEKKKKPEVTLTHFHEAAKSVHPSIDPETNKFYETIGQLITKAGKREDKRDEPYYVA